MGKTKGIRLLRKAAEDFAGFVPPKATDKIKTHPAHKALYNKTSQEPAPLKYKPQFVEKLDFGASPLGNTENIPFKISRTHLGNLPVYTDYKNDRNQQKTVIRRISGDIEEFKKELGKVVSNYEVFEKIGRIEVKGLHSYVVKAWLLKLGF